MTASHKKDNIIEENAIFVADALPPEPFPSANSRFSGESCVHLISVSKFDDKKRRLYIVTSFVRSLYVRCSVTPLVTERERRYGSGGTI